MLVYKILTDKGLHRIPGCVEFGRVAWCRKGGVAMWLGAVDGVGFCQAYRCIFV